jgi:basic membrane protein A
MLLATTACGDDGATTTTEGATTTTQASSTTEASVGAGYKVAYLPCGRINDLSWSQAGWEGVLAAKESLGLDEAALSEAVPAADIEAALRDYASRGFDVILGHCGTFASVAEQVAPDFPDAWFELSSVETSNAANAFAYDPQQQEGSFVAGVLAGLTTQSATLGVVAGFDFPAITRQVEGFRLGARFVNPDIKVLVTYINSWEDASVAKEAALAQIDSGADIIFIATDQAAIGVFEASTERGTYAIPQYFDQSDVAPEAVLTSVLYDQGASLTEIIALAIAGELADYSVFQPGVAEDVGTLASFYGLESIVPDRAKQCVDLVVAGIKDGTIAVPDTAAIGTAGSGEGIDPASIVEGGQHECLG